MMQPRVMPLNEVVHGMDQMLDRLVGEDLQVERCLADDLPPVRIDPGQMEQVLLNLVLNARDAMPNGGTLQIATDGVELDREEVRELGGSEPGRYVRLTVRDNGVGISADFLPHVFEPFFSTKAAGKGSGIGLATVYGIVRQSGGVVRASSAPGEGSCFEVILPISEGPLAGVAKVTRLAPRTGKRSGTVLLVEDESAVRSITKQMVEKGGFRVIAASDGIDGLAKADSHQGPIDLVLSDVVMPRMGGPELAKRLRSLRPEAKILLMSGHVGAKIARHGVDEEGMAIIEKPFSPELLLTRIRELLDQEPEARAADGERA